MSKRLFQFGGAAMVMGSFLGCGSGAAPTGSDSFPVERLMLVATDSGRQNVEVRTAPDQPPSRGNVSMQWSITDATSGEAQTGLELKVVPWMPAMGHGTTVPPRVVEASPGIYEIRNLYLFMPGTWQIRTDLVGASTDHVLPTFEIR